MRAIVSVRTRDSFWHPLWERHYMHHFDHVEIMMVGSSYSIGYAKMTKLYDESIERLIEDYELIVCADMDEFLVPDPEKYQDLGRYLDACEGDVIRCVGYDVMEMHGQKQVNLSVPVTNTRTMWTRNRTYDKPVIMRKKIKYSAGQHYCNMPTVQDNDLYMLHMRYADIKSLLMRRHNLNLRALIDEQDRAEPIPEKWRVI